MEQKLVLSSQIARAKHAINNMFIIIYRNGTSTGIIIANGESKKRN